MLHITGGGIVPDEILIKILAIFSLSSLAWWAWVKSGEWKRRYIEKWDK